MKTLILILSLEVFSLSSYAQTVGFSKGSQFSAYNLSGDMVVQCNDPVAGFDTVFSNCNGDILTPAEFDFFIGPKGEQANEATQVELSVVKQDQSVRSKVLDYNSESGMSKKKFNLWINTLLQKPLLGYGTNHATYKLLKNNQMVNSGQFSVNVEFSGEKICERRTYFSQNIQDCRNPYSMCERYFADQNYCFKKQ